MAEERGRKEEKPEENEEEVNEEDKEEDRGGLCKERSNPRKQKSWNKGQRNHPKRSIWVENDSCPTKSFTSHSQLPEHVHQY